MVLVLNEVVGYEYVYVCMYVYPSKGNNNKRYLPIQATHVGTGLQ